MMATAIFGLSACSDDDTGEQYLRQSELSVVSSNVLFTAGASDAGRVVVSAPQSVTASTDASWATASVVGDTVRVSVTDNAKVEGRASVLTIRSGQDSVNVTIQQQGLVFNYTGDTEFTYNDSAHAFTVPVEIEGAQTIVSTNGDWITASLDKSGLHVSMTENTTSEIRAGEVYFQGGPYKDTITVYQGELKDVVNHNYYFFAYDLSQMTEQTQNLQELQVTLPVTIQLVNNAPVINFTSMNYSLPMTFVDENLYGIVFGGQLMGTYYGSYQIYSAVVDYDLMSDLSESNQTYPSLMAAPYLAMGSIWGAIAPYGNVGIFALGLRSNVDWMSVFFNGISSYRANTLGLFAFNRTLSPWLTADGEVNSTSLSTNMNAYQGFLALYYQPQLIMSDHLGNGAKPVTIPLAGSRKAPANMKVNNEINFTRLKQEVLNDKVKRIDNRIR